MKQLSEICLVISLLFALSCGNDTLEDYLPEPQNDLAGDTLRFVSYNVKVFSYNPAYPDGNYEVIANVLQSLQPDVVCLQELDSMTNRTKRVYQLQRLAGLTGWNYRYASTLGSYDGGSYGIGIATPQAIVRSSFYYLTSVEEQRGFLIAEFAKYIVVCTHFGVNDADRKIQAQELTAKVKELYGASNKPVFLMGDLNSTPLSDTMRELYRSWTLVSTQANTTSTNCIDYVLMLSRGNRYKVLDSQVIGSSAFGNMPVESDHFPVMVTVIIP
jgi:endonuclease/exonuclease/phosphatase family metal-dependent hydrolase